MSMFLCANCDELRDADDGCDEVPGNRLICVDCMDERNEAEEAEDRRRDNPLEPDFRRIA